METLLQSMVVVLLELKKKLQCYNNKQGRHSSDKGKMKNCSLEIQFPFMVRALQTTPTVAMSCEGEPSRCEVHLLIL